MEDRRLVALLIVSKIHSKFFNNLLKIASDCFYQLLKVVVNLLNHLD